MCSQCGGNNNKDVANVQLIQDVISIKSYLQKLRRILHEVITRNFFKNLQQASKIFAQSWNTLAIKNISFTLCCGFWFCHPDFYVTSILQKLCTYPETVTENQTILYSHWNYVVVSFSPLQLLKACKIVKNSSVLLVIKHSPKLDLRKI